MVIWNCVVLSERRRTYFIFCIDICEDPEMKSRIAALRTEQESRARAGNHKSRRSQSSSTNTRTHSIRRNSTRDKGQISKRQIKDEAIFVIQDVRLLFSKHLFLSRDYYQFLHSVCRMNGYVTVSIRVRRKRYRWMIKLEWRLLKSRRHRFPVGYPTLTAIKDKLLLRLRPSTAQTAEVIQMVSAWTNSLDYCIQFFWCRGSARMILLANFTLDQLVIWDKTLLAKSARTQSTLFERLRGFFLLEGLLVTHDVRTSLLHWSSVLVALADHAR